MPEKYGLGKAAKWFITDFIGGKDEDAGESEYKGPKSCEYNGTIIGHGLTVTKSDGKTYRCVEGSWVPVKSGTPEFSGAMKKQSEGGAGGE